MGRACRWGNELNGPRTEHHQHLAKGTAEGAKVIPSERVNELQARNTSERIFYVGDPTLSVYLPQDNANGCAVVICPGGGYNMLAWQKEGLELAEWFNSLGVTAAVLKYRVPRRDPDRPHEEPLQDAQRAIRLLRHHSADWKVDPNRVGVLGFSAGGHLTIMTGTKWNEPSYTKVDEADEQKCRPDFICPIYAAYLGDNYKDDVAELGSLAHITSQTPPTFMAVTWDDKMRGAQAALLFAELRRARVPAELHVYSKGGHGYGIRPSDRPVSKWHLRLHEWLKDQGLLKRAN